MSYYTLFRNLTRQGPGEVADVAWAAAQADLTRDALICDVACGSGADIAPLLAACPDGHVTAFDKQPHFIDEAKARVGDDPRVSLRVGDMADLGGPYDFIWCAGAVYFLGIKEALMLWRPALHKGGAIAFSLPCWWTDTPAKPAQDFWAEYTAMTDEAGIFRQVETAGFKSIAKRCLAASAWNGYYTSLENRIDMLRKGSDPDLQVVLDKTAEEIAIWRTHGADYGYLLSVVRPV